MREIQIIKNFHKGKYPNDDCYFDGERLYTTDSLIEGTHFLHEWSSPENLARKLVEVNLSDILSSGGLPEFCFLNLGLSKISQEKRWVQRFTHHFLKILHSYKIKLVGGDSFYSKITLLSLTLVSSKQTKKPITREGSKPNEFLYITGALGYSYLGYKLLKNKIKPKSQIEKLAIQKHLEPYARWDLRKKISQFKITSMMDITDGLIQDLQKLSLCSKIGFIINVEKLPQFKEISEYLTLEEILSSGEELELLFTSKEKITIKGIYHIGYSIIDKNLKFLFEGKKVSIQNFGFEHFS